MNFFNCPRIVKTYWETWQLIFSDVANLLGNANLAEKRGVL